MTSSSLGRLMSPLSQKQTDKSWFTFGYPDWSNSYLRSPHSLTHSLTKLVGAQKIYRAFLCITLNPQSGDSSGVMLGVRSVALLHLYLSSLSANNLHEVTIYLRNVLTSKNIFLFRQRVIFYFTISIILPIFANKYCIIY